MIFQGFYICKEVFKKSSLNDLEPRLLPRVELGIYEVINKIQIVHYASYDLRQIGLSM